MPKCATYYLLFVVINVYGVLSIYSFDFDINFSYTKLTNENHQRKWSGNSFSPQKSYSIMVPLYNRYRLKFFVQVWHETTYALDVLWGQGIKQNQVASASELLKNQWNDLLFFKIIPSHFCRASEASKIDFFKN